MTEAKGPRRTVRHDDPLILQTTPILFDAATMDDEAIGRLMRRRGIEDAGEDFLPHRIQHQRAARSKAGRHIAKHARILGIVAEESERSEEEQHEIKRRRPSKGPYVRPRATQPQLLLSLARSRAR